MPDIRSLEGENEGRIYDAFMAAFADYSVPIRMTTTEFAENNARRGFDPSISLGAYDGDSLVGFVLNGRGRWDGRPAAYDLGTGVLPAARGSGLAGTLASRLVAYLPARALELYVLEVIRDNLPAFKTYEKAGFSITRSLECPDGSYADAGRPTPEGLGIVELSDGAAFPRAQVARFRDWEPSWQNSDDSIVRMPGRLVILGARLGGGSGRLAGFIVASPKGTIWQFAVARDLRRRGIGSALLRELA
ncbi:MAG: GNAT family N-acetyltransferase, partial [Spirochaetaceae bacterium]|nr:GNAT family N-acetyltransferase [Spirochaetaceae bacterium]